MNFDPQTGQPIDPNKKPTPPAINTRTFLYHKARPAIVVEGRGATDAEKRADLARQIEAKKNEGYSTTRFHGQHPHSFDDHRMEWQRRSAENGDKEAAQAIKEKTKQRDDKTAPAEDKSKLKPAEI